MTRPLRDAPQFYLTSPTTCPYLPGREERKVFTHLVGSRARELNDVLSQGGFRRSQSIAYRPACEICRACVSVRVCVDDFLMSRGFRRVLARNTDLIGEALPPRPRSEHYSLFRSYLGERHPQKITDSCRNPRRTDIIGRFVLLEDCIHCADIVFCMSPISFCIKVS